MRRILLAAAVLALFGLSGCSALREMLGGKAATDGLVLPPLAVRANPQVTVVNNQIVVKPEVLIFGINEGPVPITFSLPRDPDSRLRFSNGGGVFIEGTLQDRIIRAPDGTTGVALDAKQTQVGPCEVAKDQLSVVCPNRNTGPIVFKYTIRVFDGRQLLSRDPPGINGAGM